MGMKFLKILAWATFIELALVTVAEATASHHSRAQPARIQAASVYYVLPAYRRGFTGGWYALNYHYFYGHAPLVSYDDPYDYNGNYFPARRN
jgi:hypothetical protein